jgi:hypothetical protein
MESTMLTIDRSRKPDVEHIGVKRVVDLRGELEICLARRLNG